jgi:hypothetical protein
MKVSFDTAMNRLEAYLKRSYEANGGFLGPTDQGYGQHMLAAGVVLAREDGTVTAEEGTELVERLNHFLELGGNLWEQSEVASHHPPGTPVVETQLTSTHRAVQYDDNMYLAVDDGTGETRFLDVGEVRMSVLDIPTGLP